MLFTQFIVMLFCLFTVYEIKYFRVKVLSFCFYLMAVCVSKLVFLIECLHGEPMEVVTTVPTNL